MQNKKGNFDDSTKTIKGVYG